MTQSEIFTPFLGMLVLTLVVWIFMYSKRLPFIFANQFDPNEITPEEFNRLSPSNVRNPLGQSEEPVRGTDVLFYARMSLPVRNRTGGYGLCFVAWVFFVFASCSGAVHCLTNNIMLRFGVYCVSAAAVWFMALRAIWTQWSSLSV